MRGISACFYINKAHKRYVLLTKTKTKEEKRKKKIKCGKYINTQNPKISIIFLLYNSGGKIQQAVNALGFTQHVIIVKAGEDVVTKIMSFSQNGRAVCMLSVTGVVSNVTLRQAARGVVTYEGCFEILSLSGSFLHSESSGQSVGIGGLNISLSGGDDAIIGGSMAGVLRAASSVQVIVCSFIAEDRKESKLQTNQKYHLLQQIL